MRLTLVHSVCLWALTAVACTPSNDEGGARTAAEKREQAVCLDPGDPAYDVNLGEPKCRNQGVPTDKR